MSQASYEHTRAYWDQIGVTIVGRHVFDLTDAGGTPPSGIDHVVVVSHRPAPEGWHPRRRPLRRRRRGGHREGREPAGDRIVEVGPATSGARCWPRAVDEVGMDVAPVVIGSGSGGLRRGACKTPAGGPRGGDPRNWVLDVRHRVRR